MKAELVPSLSYSSDNNAVTLRYFTATTVQEYYIPIWELRSRNPATGNRTEVDVSLSDIELENKYKNMIPTKFDMKGNYGVSFVWSDGFYMDIFPFEVLREMADNIN